VFAMSNLGHNTDPRRRKGHFGTDSHWTESYRTDGRLIYEVDSFLYQNFELTATEIEGVLSVANTSGRDLRSPILELACGPGRHGLHLARLGYDVVGLDLSETFLEIARDNAQSAGMGPKIVVVRGDYRQLEFASESFPCVLMLGSSFGYFSEDENEQVLREAYRVLKLGGLLCLDSVDRRRCVSEIQPYYRWECDTESFGRVIGERWGQWNEATNRLVSRKKHTALSGDVLLDLVYDIRLYSEEELKVLLEVVGFGRSYVGALPPGTPLLRSMRNRILIGAIKDA
jgi:D-alanine-D-alanine ligase